MAEISFVKLNLAELAMEYAEMGGGMATDEEVALWARVLIKALVSRDPDAHPFAARLLGEAEEFRRAEVERKRRAREDREAAEESKRGAGRRGAAASKDSAESTERAHRSDKADQTSDQNNMNHSEESAESTESAPGQPMESQAGTNSGPPSSKATRPKRETGGTPKTERPEKEIIPPKLEWVADYCQKRNNGIDPEHFMAHYAKQSWKTSSGVKVTNWQAAIVTWEKNRADFRGRGGRRTDSEPVGPLV